MQLTLFRSGPPESVASIPAEAVRRMEELTQACEWLKETIGRRRKRLPPDQQRMAARLVGEVEAMLDALETARDQMEEAT